MLISVVNKSARVSNSDVQLMCEAVNEQLILHVAPAWNAKPATVQFYSDATKVPGYAWKMIILDEPDVAGALGYHEETGDTVDGYVFVNPVLDNGGVVFYDPTNPQNVSVSSVLSHEILEQFGDRFANMYCDNGNTSFAVELCDAVEQNLYTISINGTLVGVSDFLFPSWFNPEGTAEFNMPFNYLNTLTKPFTIDNGGYVIVRTGGPGTETQIFGQDMLDWKKELKKGEFARSRKRMKPAKGFASALKRFFS